ncbi:hypothetical protein FPRO06_07869 [Fusarium proliferatum]|nr:hypothetical protein FPRO06_07869 [Fusarium proliferatum]
MNWAWTQIQISYALAAAARGEPGIECIVPSRRDSTSTRRESTSTENTRDTPNSIVPDDNNFDVQSAAQSFVSQSLPPVPVFSEIDTSLDVPSFLDNSLDTLPFDFVPEQTEPVDANFYGIQFKDLTAPEEPLSEPWDFCKDSTISPELQFDVASMSQFPTVSPMEPAQSLIAVSPNNEKDWRRTKRRRMSNTWSDTQSSSLSSFTMDQSMMTRSNNLMISTNLLQIYHDVLEHNLSCWLNEVTCPFGRQQKTVSQPGNLAEWGSSWTNRVLRRTMNLDRVAQSTQLVHLSRQQDSATAKALHLCIMAFATQWAQSSRRHRERYPSLDDIAEENPLNECMDDFKEEFDRHLQRNIWDQARRALDDVADVESYRVVCAEMIFGLTQKPLDPEDTEHSDVDTSGCFEDVYDMQSVADEIASIIENDGPPIFMERAARKMHTLKYRFDAERKGLTKGRKRANPVASMSSEDAGTVSLLYWLTVMFDTVSSTMSERPLVVVDANSQHDDARGDTDWNVPLFIQDSLEKPRQNFHWPCSYEEAAEAVTRSAPVKVLMFRHVAYLQNLLRQGESGEKVEGFIERSARVYRYWNTTYGTFFRELLQNYNSIPGRIQSWFICICAHWNLGVLLLADLIHHIDEHALGLPAPSQSRSNCKWVMRIRERSARELSDLARVTAPDNRTPIVPTLSEFHHAINQCMILTEPWTSGQIDYIPVTHAIHRVDGIVTPASSAHSASELEHQLRSSGAKALFTCTPLLSTALKAASAVGIPEKYIFLLPLPKTPSEGSFKTIEDLIAEGKTLPPLELPAWTPGQGKRQVAYLCYSSGTSGLPKAVMISHYNVIACTLMIHTFESITRAQDNIDTQVALGLLPFSHIYGLVVIAHIAQYRGDEIIVLQRFQLDQLLAAIEKFRIEQLSVVPPIIVQILSSQDKCQKYNLDSVRLVFSGAAPLGGETIQKLLELYPKWRISQGYGLTEASPAVFHTSEADPVLGSSGSLLPGAKVKIIDQHGSEVTSYETPGELYVQAPNVVLGYLHNEKTNAETFVHRNDGRWLRTGDEVLVRKSPRGNDHFFIVDRIKELIKVKGHQVAPAELEAHLLDHPYVDDCAVIGIVDERAGEVPLAFIVKSKKTNGLKDEHVVKAVCEHVESHKARHKWLKGGVRVLDVIPKSPSGKILRRVLKAQIKAEKPVAKL